MSEKVTIIGAGVAGKALMKGCLRAGREVSVVVSDLAKYANITSENQDVSWASLEMLKKDPKRWISPITILALPYRACLEVASSIDDWHNTILIDMATPKTKDLDFLEVGWSSSASEEIAKKAPSARVVKGFATMGAEVMESPNLAQGKVFMPVCGDDVGAKEAVMRLGKEMALDAVDAGPLRNARLIEPLGLLWVQLSIKLPKGRTFEYSLIDKETS